MIDGLLRSHELLLEAEREMIPKHIELLANRLGIPASKLVVFVVDLSGLVGNLFGSEAFGAEFVETRIRERSARNLPPSQTIPLEEPGGLVMIREYLPEFFRPIVSRPAGTTAIIVIDINESLVSSSGRVDTAHCSSRGSRCAGEGRSNGRVHRDRAGGQNGSHPSSGTGSQNFPWFPRGPKFHRRPEIPRGPKFHQRPGDPT